jgi:hypothetical protein
MAKIAESKNQTGEKVRPVLPVGYLPVQAERTSAWFEPSALVACHGIIKGRFVMRARQYDESYYYQVLLLENTQGRVKEGEDSEYEQTVVKAGSLINVKEVYELQGLAAIQEKAEKEGYKVDVWIQPLEKKAIAGGQSVWHFELGWKKAE